MKKITMLLATGLAAVAMAGCGGGSDDKGTIKNISGGTADEQQAIQNAAEMSIVLLSGGSGILPTDTIDLAEDNGDYIKVSTSQVVRVNGAKYTVNFEWGSDSSNPYFASYSTLDATHGIFEINYPGKNGQDGTIDINLNKVSCGGASSTDTGLTYHCNVKKGTYYHKDVHISDLNKLKDIGGGQWGYDVVDYVTKPENAYYTPNPENEGLEKQYFYVNIFGKMIYCAPDGNWGLLADGDKILEIYAGSALDISPTRYPAINGGYVKVVGNMSQHLGNIQTGFVTEIKKASLSDLEAEPTLTYESITKSMVQAITKGTDASGNPTHYQCLNIGGQDINLSNALKSFTGKYVEGSLLGNDGKETTVSSLKSGARFSFLVNIGDDSTPCNVRVAYDYHTDKDGSVGVFNALKNFITSGAEKTIKGTLRFNGSDSNPFNQVGGEWQLVPFLADHVA